MIQQQERQTIARPLLGDWCDIHATAHKSRSDGRTKWWSLNHREPKRAMFIGQRTVHNGRVEYVRESYDVGYYEFIHESSRIVWMFIEDVYRNPIYAFPEDVS